MARTHRSPRLLVTAAPGLARQGAPFSWEWIVDQERPEPIVEAVPARRKAEWSAPEVDRLIAGGAEASAGADVEGLDGLS